MKLSRSHHLDFLLYPDLCLHILTFFFIFFFKCQQVLQFCLSLRSSCDRGSKTFFHILPRTLLPEINDSRDKSIVGGTFFFLFQQRQSFSSLPLIKLGDADRVIRNDSLPRPQTRKSFNHHKLVWVLVKFFISCPRLALFSLFLPVALPDFLSCVALIPRFVIYAACSLVSS